MQFVELAKKANLQPATVVTFSFEPNSGDIVAFWTGEKLVDINNERKGREYVYDDGWDAFHAFGAESCCKANIPFFEVSYSVYSLLPQEVLNAADEPDREGCYLYVVTNPSATLSSLDHWTTASFDGKEYVFTGNSSVYK